MTAGAPEVLGRLDDHFELQSEIHTGNMSRVFRAKDLKTGGLVAVKRPVRDSARDLGRFHQESALLAELDHPSIVRFVAKGGTTFADTYLATEWVNGETLRARLARGALSVRESVAIARAAAEALGAAHRVRVIHRDMKPANLLMRENSQVTLIDFGIARRESGAGLSAHVSFDGGTWAYMSPEQVMGAAELGPRVDIFSLGCVLFECLSGTLAFPAERAAAIVAKVWHDPPALSDRRADLPKSLVRLVQKFMAKDPSHRPRDGTSAAAELAALDGIG